MEEFVVVLAGGRGERFWPLSRANRPKQLLKLISNRTMLKETIERTLPLVPMERTFIVTGGELAKLIKEQHPEFPEENYIIEPMGKNTAPAICLAAANIVAKYGDGIMFVLASDHYIEPQSTFLSVLRAAKEAVIKTDRLILMGIEPTRAETAYGYIQVGEKLLELNDAQCYEVKNFKEKPDKVKAQEFYLSGEYLWNSGNFIMRARRILEEAKVYLPQLANDMEKYIDNFGSPEAEEILREAFERAPSTSIDYAILEKTKNVAVIWGKFYWDDVGSWGAMERVLKSDKFGNVVAGDGDFLILETYESTIFNDSPGLIATFGVSDLVIVRMDDITLVLNKTRIPQMRELISKLKEDEKFKKYL